MPKALNNGSTSSMIILLHLQLYKTASAPLGIVSAQCHKATLCSSGIANDHPSRTHIVSAQLKQLFVNRN